MTHGVFSVAPDATLRQAADAILDRKISCVGVLDEKGGIQGILNWRDLLHAMVDPEGSLDGTPPPAPRDSVERAADSTENLTD